MHMVQGFFRQVWLVGGWAVKLCDPLVTHGLYLSALPVVLPIIRCYTNHQITILQSSSAMESEPDLYSL